MNGSNKGTRMPDVSLKVETIEENEREATPIPENKMFKKKKANLALEVKEIDNPNYVTKVLDDIQEESTGEEVKKVKKKLTDKQLEALKRGREKSIATRRARKEALLQEKVLRKEEKALANANIMEDMANHADEVNMPTKQKKQVRYAEPPSQSSSGGWDYDRIISGLADEQDKRSKARENREHQVAEDIKKYENQIRQDERARILAEVEAEEQQEIQLMNSKKTHSIFNPQIPVNAYSRTAYGQFGSRSRRNF